MLHKKPLKRRNKIERVDFKKLDTMLLSHRGKKTVHRLRNQQKESSSKHYKGISWADGRHPFFSNAFTIKRILPSLEENHQKHGPIFKMQIFRRTFAIVCDNKQAQESLCSKENS